MGIIIDTCVWIDVERGTRSPADVATFTKGEPVYLSPVSIAELRYGVEICTNPAIKQRRASALARLCTKPVLPIDVITGETFGRLAAELSRKKTKGHAHRVQDLWIAAQAIQYNYPLLTWNLKDFTDIPGLEIMTFPDPA